MTQISDLESRITALEQDVPAFIRKVLDAARPARDKLIADYGNFVRWLGEAWEMPRTPKGIREAIEDLAWFLDSRCWTQCGTHLDAALDDAGFRDIDPGVHQGADDGAGLDPESARELVAQMLAGLGLNPPSAVVDAMVESEVRGAPGGAAWVLNQWLHEDASGFSSGPGESDDGAPKKKRRGRPPKPKAAELDAEALQKQLYRGLARDLHPDKTQDAEEREARTGLMQKLNDAYHAGDLRTLLQLLHIHGSDSLKSGLGTDSEQQLISALEHQAKELKKRLKDVQVGLPKVGVDWLAVVRSSSLQERLLREEKRRAEGESLRFRQVSAMLQEPKELHRFLRQSDESDWERIF